MGVDSPPPRDPLATCTVNLGTRISRRPASCGTQSTAVGGDHRPSIERLIAACSASFSGTIELGLSPSYGCRQVVSELDLASDQTHFGHSLNSFDKLLRQDGCACSHRRCSSSAVGTTCAPSPPAAAVATWRRKCSRTSAINVHLLRRSTHRVLQRIHGQCKQCITQLCGCRGPTGKKQLADSSAHNVSCTARIVHRF